jgi:hypothetical protein
MGSVGDDSRAAISSTKMDELGLAQTSIDENIDMLPKKRPLSPISRLHKHIGLFSSPEFVTVP